MEYMIVSGTGSTADLASQNLVAKVQIYIAARWEPIGGVTFYRSIEEDTRQGKDVRICGFYQAMVRRPAVRAAYT